MDIDLNKPVVNSYNSPDEVPEELDREKAKETYYNMLKKKRNNLLIETDIYMLPDFPITPEKLIIIKEYRQALRDFNKNNYIIPNRPDFVITMN
jgi:hypothetical protein